MSIVRKIVLVRKYLYKGCKFDISKLDAGCKSWDIVCIRTAAIRRFHLAPTMTWISPNTRISTRELAGTACKVDTYTDIALRVETDVD